jgi:hypothetical protein
LVFYQEDAEAIFLYAPADEGMHKIAVPHVIALRPIASSKKHHGCAVPVWTARP